MSPASNRPLKVGVVGAGIAHSADGRENWAVRAHLPALKELPELYEVAAVCTTRMESANESAKHFDVPHAFDSVESMLEGVPDLDIVCVSVRPVHHYGIAMAALNAGKHVYCEHPGGTSTQQAKDMLEVAKRNNLRTMSGHQAHFDPAERHMADLISQGFIGDLVAVGMTHFGANYIAPRPYFHRWLFEAADGGVRPGYRSGNGLRGLMAVTGQDVTSVSADFTIQVPERPALDVDKIIYSDQVDNMNFLLKIGDAGAVGTLQVSNTAWFGTGDRLEVYGTKGMLVLMDSPVIAAAPDKAEGTSNNRPTRLYGAQADVESIIESKKPPEHLQSAFAEIAVPERPIRTTLADNQRPQYQVSPVRVDQSRAFETARAWVAFSDAIRDGHDVSPSLYDTYKNHCIWDAAEESVKTRKWVDVKY